MKQILQKISYTSLLTGMALLLLSSCLVDEREAYPDDLIQPERDGSEVTFALEVPATTYTRGGTKNLPIEDNELKITDFQVLVFDPEEDKFLYSTSTTKVEATDTINIKTITVKLLDGLLENNTYDLIFLANARSILQTLYPGGITKGLSKEEVLESLRYETTSRVITTENGLLNPIPMWGKRDKVRLGSSDLITSPVIMVRSVAKVNLSLADEAFQNFTLQSVHVYNYIPGGYLAPLTNEWTGDDTIESPYIPALLDPVKTPLLYTEVTGGKSIRDIIYIFEAAKGSPTTLLDNICLVVGGTYKGTISYYRLDFVDQTDNYTSLLRNYCYEVVITSINGAGYSTPDEAFRAGPFDMKVEILNWREGDMKEFVIDGQYLISLSQGEFTFSREERHEFSTDNKLTVYTNYPEGWYVLKSSIIDDETGTTPIWLELSADGLTVSGDTLRWGQTTRKQISLLADEYTSIIPLGRSASFMVRAGRLNYQVKVKQTYEAGSNVNIYILDSEGAEINYLEFPGNSTDPKEMILTWSPALENQFVTVLNMVDKSSANKFPFRVPVFSVGQTIYGYPNPGRRSYTITPDLMAANSDPFHENSTTVTFEIEYGTKKIEKDFTFLQVNRGIKVVAEDFYPANGGIQSFTIQSNTAWKGELVNGGGAVEELLTTSGGNAPSGEPVYIQTIDYQREDIRTAEFWFTSYTHEFDTVKVFLNFYGQFILTATNEASYKADGSSYNFLVTANIAWTVMQTGSGISDFTPQSGGAGVTPFTITTVDLSMTAYSTFLFISGTQSVSIPITLIPNDFIVETNKESGYEANGDTYTFQVTANRDWTASLLENSGHISDIITKSGSSGTTDFSFQTNLNGMSGKSVIRFVHQSSPTTTAYQDVEIGFMEVDEFIITSTITSQAYPTYVGESTPYSFTVTANKAWTLKCISNPYDKTYAHSFSPISGGPGTTTVDFLAYGYVYTSGITTSRLEFTSGSQTEVFIFRLNHPIKPSYRMVGVLQSYKADGNTYSFEVHASTPNVRSMGLRHNEDGFIRVLSQSAVQRGGLYGYYWTITFETNEVSKKGIPWILFDINTIEVFVMINFDQ